MNAKQPTWGGVSMPTLSTGKKTLLQWIMIGIVAAISMYYGSWAPFAVLFLCLSSLGLRVILDALGLLTFWVNQEPDGRLFVSAKAYWFCVGWAFIGVLASAFVSLPFYGNNQDYRVIENSGGAVYTRDLQMAMYIPFVDNVQIFGSSVSASPVCQARTSDGRAVQAKVESVFSLDFTRLVFAHRAAGTHKRLQELAGAHLCERFAETIARHAIAEIPSTLVIESSAGDNRYAITSMGLAFKDVIRVSDMHAYVVR